jgi:multidrug efflux pump subunit AcrB
MGILLIDMIERNRKEGMNLSDTVMNGSLSRIRPILMTAAATILILLPLAHNADIVISQTVGIVVVGGILTSTLNSFSYQKDRSNILLSFIATEVAKIESNRRLMV